MVQFPAFASRHTSGYPVKRDGLPHSEIFGSKVICTYPKLIAACHVLHRLWKPRHPPCALSNFFLIIYVANYSKYLLKTYLRRISIQDVKDRYCGEYRTRTDDLLRARQAL